MEKASQQKTVTNCIAGNFAKKNPVINHRNPIGENKDFWRVVELIFSF